MFDFFSWIFESCKEFARMTNWLITPLPLINTSPLLILSASGLVTMITIHIIILFVGLGR